MHLVSLVFIFLSPPATMDLRCVKMHLETPFLPTSLDKHEGLEMCQNSSQDPLPSSLPLTSTRPEMCLGLVLFLLFFSVEQASSHYSGPT